MIKKILVLSLTMAVLPVNFAFALQKNEDKNMTRSGICKENFEKLFNILIFHHFDSKHEFKAGKKQQII